MVEAWICLTRSDCTEGAIEGLEAAIFEAGYLEDQIFDHCYDSIDRSEVCYVDEVVDSADADLIHPRL